MIRMAIVMWLAACGEGAGGGGTDGACELADSIQGCDECDNGPLTCTFGDVSETRVSCGECQARSALYDALCDAGETATAEQIEADTVCVQAATEN